MDNQRPEIVWGQLGTHTWKLLGSKRSALIVKDSEKQWRVTITTNRGKRIAGNGFVGHFIGFAFVFGPELFQFGIFRRMGLQFYFVT